MEIFSYKLIIRSRFHFIRWLTCNLFGLINERRTGESGRDKKNWSCDHSLWHLFFIGLEIAVNAPIICAVPSGLDIYRRRIYDIDVIYVLGIQNGS